jgi:hypothetical protein
MVRRAGAARTLFALLGLACAGGCKDRVATGDAGTDATPGDGPAGDLPGALALDFAVTGCASYDLKAARCTGTPPLAVTFAPVSSASFTKFLWTFGDGTPPSADRAPTHTYVLPGSYDVSLVAEGTVGSVSRMRGQFMDVSPVAAGAPCDVDAQCAGGLQCLCGSGHSCGPGFPRGICTRDCAAKACDDPSACATISVPASAAPATPAADAGADASAGDARDASDAPIADGPVGSTDGAPSDAPAAGGKMSLCLASCFGGTTCPAGLVCRSLPAARGPMRWEPACVPAAYRDVGEACRDATGALDDDACATGRCAELGALGICSATCGAGAACPDGSACATLHNGQSMCLRACGDAFACDTDPLLACEPPGSAGPLGFDLMPPGPNSQYCAPKRCATETHCQPAGTCLPPGAGGHCQLP